MSNSIKHSKAVENMVECAQAAFDGKDYSEAINIATKELDTLSPEAESVAQLYYIRAMAKGKIAKFQAAEKDGYSIIRLDVDSVQGHLCLANLYTMQGKQRDCIEICERAFRVLHHWKDPVAEKQLLDLHASAEKRLQNRVDFVNLLPQEILIQALGSLSTEELSAVALASESWYTRVTHCESLWRSVEISTDDKASWLVIPSIGHHVWNAFYFSGSQSVWDQQCQKMTRSAVKEQALLYREKAEHDYHGKIDPTNSTYYFGFCWHMVSVFAAFPNLKRLEFNGGPPAAHCDSLTLLPQHMHLTTLKLNTMTIQQNDHLERVLRRCHSIRRLYISNCDWRILEVIEQLGTLDVLVIHFYQPAMTLQHRFMSTICTEEEPSKGLLSLALEAASQDNNPHRAHFTCYDISGLVANNCDTLEELVVTCRKQHDQQLYNEMNRAIQWDRILSAQYPNLQRLCCVIPNSKENEFAALIRQCDSLVDCTVVHPQIIPEIVLDALSTKKSLRRLELTFGIRGDIDDSFLDDLFTEGIGIEQLETLSGLPLDGLDKLLRLNNEGFNGIQHICFKNCTLIVPSILNTLASSTLRGIEFCGSIFFQKNIRDFVVKLGRSPSLEWIIFDSILCSNEEGEWCLGMECELFALRLNQIFQAPKLPTSLFCPHLSTYLIKPRNPIICQSHTCY